MAIPENVSTALAGNADVLKFVQDLDAKASLVTPELQAELPKLAEYKGHAAAVAKILQATGAKDVDALTTDFANMKAVNADLVKQRDTWKAGGKGTDSPEYRALLEQIEANKTATADILTKLKAADDKAAAADVKARETTLEAAMVAAGAKLKARNAGDEFLLLKAKGLVGHKEDGTPFFNKLNEKGEKVAVNSAEELMAWHLNQDKSKIDPSGKQGTGTQHGGSGGGAGEIKTVQDARAAFRATRMAQ